MPVSRLTPRPSRLVLSAALRRLRLLSRRLNRLRLRFLLARRYHARRLQIALNYVHHQQRFRGFGFAEPRSDCFDWIRLSTHRGSSSFQFQATVLTVVRKRYNADTVRSRPGAARRRCGTCGTTSHGNSCSFFSGEILPCCSNAQRF